jgi:hypothetical protein
MKLGEVLIHHGWISQSQLNEALCLQFRKYQRLGSILVRQKWITEDCLQQALLEQYWRTHGYWIID